MSCEGADTQTTPGPRQAAGEGVNGQSVSGAWHSLSLGGGPGEPSTWRPGARVTLSTFGRLDAHVQLCTCGRALKRMSCGILAWDRSSETPMKIPSPTSLEFEAPAGLSGAQARLCPQGNLPLPRHCSDAAGPRVAVGLYVSVVPPKGWLSLLHRKQVVIQGCGSWLLGAPCEVEEGSPFSDCPPFPGTRGAPSWTLIQGYIS